MNNLEDWVYIRDAAAKVLDRAAMELRLAVARETVLTCKACGHKGKDVTRWQAKVGGSDELQDMCSCDKIDECLGRQAL